LWPDRFAVLSACPGFRWAYGRKVLVPGCTRAFRSVRPTGSWAVENRNAGRVVGIVAVNTPPKALRAWCTRSRRHDACLALHCFQSIHSGR
jgi:hypothetical protein